MTDDHKLSLTLPEGFPTGPAEVIVLSSPRSNLGPVVLGGVLATIEVDELVGDPVAEALGEVKMGCARTNPFKEFMRGHRPG